MRHFVCMKFEPGFFSPAVFEEIAAAFAALREALPEEILACTVHKNVVEREQNMDLMIEMELKDAGSLEKYLPHPLHRGIGKKMDPHIVKIASFDCDQTPYLSSTMH